jgi:hypothetical protein
MIKVLKTKINVAKVTEQLKKYPQDWDHQKHLKDSQSLVDRGFADLPTSALQLIIGGVKKKKTLLEILKSISKLLHMNIITKSEKLFVKSLETKNYNVVDSYPYRLMKLWEHTLMKELTT